MSVRVVSRIRPLLKSENVVDNIITPDSTPDASHPNLVKIPNPKNVSEEFSFQFQNVYDQDSTQQTIFDAEIAPTIKHLFNGFDVTIFAYGSTGTGKTYTMRGGKALADRGMIPRMLSGIFRRAKKLDKGGNEVQVSMSYYEIYNDRVFDLFEPPEKRAPSGLPVREVAGGRTVVAGLTEREIQTIKEFEVLYDEANRNRSTGATKLNALSSRSHAILCVKLSITDIEGIRISTASAIDLAGSEDNRKTGNGKERMVESASINKSLFNLAQCVEAISKKQHRIPYRESKMTRILALGQNNGLTVMILNLAPTKTYHFDTLSSLNFANRTKKIEVKEVENEPIFKGPPRAVSGVTAIIGANIQRQPLRPLTAGVNLNLGAAQAASKSVDKPAKSFAVYSDRLKSRNSGFTVDAGQSDEPRRISLQKRGAEGFNSLPTRPSKMIRPSNTGKNQSQRMHQGISKANIEELVSKKVEEILATRTLDTQAESSSRSIDAEVQRRLNSIEERLEGQEGAKAEGLSYLLMAKQHQARGENGSAFKMYQLALPFFPENEKLLRKIEGLRQKTQFTSSKRVNDEQVQNCGSLAQTLVREVHPSRPRPALEPLSKPRRRENEDQSYVDEGSQLEDNGDSYGSDSSFHVKNKRPKRPSHQPITSLPDDGCVTPRTSHLLRIINSRDVSQIKLLKGVGTKKAENIVSCLCEMDDNVDGDHHGVVQSLTELGRLKGVGLRTVQSMRNGL